MRVLLEIRRAKCVVACLLALFNGIETCMHHMGRGHLEWHCAMDSWHEVTYAYQWSSVVGCAKFTRPYCLLASNWVSSIPATGVRLPPADGPRQLVIQYCTLLLMLWLEFQTMLDIVQYPHMLGRAIGDLTCKGFKCAGGPLWQRECCTHLNTCIGSVHFAWRSNVIFWCFKSYVDWSMIEHWKFLRGNERQIQNVSRHLCRLTLSNYAPSVNI